MTLPTVLTLPQLDAVRSAARDFAIAEIAPLVARMERERLVDRHLPRLLAEEGWVGATVPSRYGGMDVGHTAGAIIVEEVSRVSAAAGAILQAITLGTAPILHLGTAQQQERWLPAIASGQMIPTIAVTEPDSGGHVLGMHATARRRGRGWEVTAVKCHIGNSHVATHHVVVARTGPGSRGLTAFVVRADSPGVSLAPHGRLLGLHGFSAGRVHFAGVRVGDDHVLGEVGDGLTAAYATSILYGRPQLAAVALGLHTALLNSTVAFAEQRPRYGRTIADLPTVIDKIGRIEANRRSAALALYTATRDLDLGQPCDADLIHAKLVGGDLLLDSVRIAMEVHGAGGLDDTAPVARCSRDAFHIYAPAGTADIQRLRLAQHARGLDTHHQQFSEIYPGRWAHLHTPTPLPAAHPDSTRPPAANAANHT